VTVAPSLAEGRTALKSGPRDVVTLDYQLPDGTGLDMLDEITSEPGHPPVVMITGHGDEELAYLSFRMGASGYAAKDRKLSVALPEAIEWAMADAALKRGSGAEQEDRRLAGLLESTHAVSTDLRLELDAIRAACRRLDTAQHGLSDESAVKLRKSQAAVEKSLRRCYTLVEKLASLVHPEDPSR
jgi:two-component system sensor histidine kinase/response regulator